MKKKKDFMVSGILLFLAIIYTLLVKIVDVQAIGPNDSKVGFASLNGFISKLIGSNMTFYKITEYLGYIAILMALIYALIGLIQVIKRKSLLKVDKEIIALGVFYVVVIILYVFFEKVIINYRPILIDGILEASYPSSHTILSICLCGSSIIINNQLFKKFKIAKYENILSIVLIVSIIGGRIISGVHWFTDIIGGVIFSIALLYTFKMVLDKMKKEN